MDIKESIQTCFQKYATFSGTAGRPEFWWFFLFSVIVNLVTSGISTVIGFIASLAMLLPSLAVGARRLHDTGRSGWWQLLWFVPFVGWAVMVYFLVQPGRGQSA